MNLNILLFFPPLSFVLAFMYILRSRRRNFKRKNYTFIIPVLHRAIPVDSATCLIFEPLKTHLCHVAGTCRINDRYLTQFNVTLLKIVFGKVIEINT